MNKGSLKKKRDDGELLDGYLILPAVAYCPNNIDDFGSVYGEGGPMVGMYIYLLSL